MAATREKRSNAGNRMSRLLDNEEDDEFYKTTYGGFDEVEEDKEYESEESDSDDTDSDIDIDETEEVKSDDDGEPVKKKRKAGIITKAYKEVTTKKKPSTEAKPKPKPKPKPKVEHIVGDHAGRGARRQTTVEKSRLAEQRKLERDIKVQMMKDLAAKKNVTEVRRLTQEELVEEAKETERINLASLEEYSRLELLKKKARPSKSVYRGPVIRYHSLSMPLVEELPDTDLNVDGDVSEMKKIEGPKCSRTFLTFTDDEAFKEAFPPKRKPKPPPKQYCPVTRLRAQYFDPVTLTPYRTVLAFKKLREEYEKHIKNVSERRLEKLQQQAIKEFSVYAKTNS